MLFDTCHIGGIDAACPIVRSATFEGMADEHGYPTENLTQVYTRLADGGIGIMITGMMAASSLEPRQHRQICIDNDSCIAPLAAMTRHVHEHHGKIIAQIVVMGSSIMLPEGSNRIIVSPSGVTEKLGKITQESHALTVEEISRLVDDVGKAALRAKKAGFDGVQFHSAQGENYDAAITPTIFQRSMASCKMHKARIRANNYYWNKLFRKLELEGQQEEIERQRLKSQNAINDKC